MSKQKLIPRHQEGDEIRPASTNGTAKLEALADKYAVTDKGYKLTDYQRAQASKMKGKQRERYIKEMDHRNRTGKSKFMQDINSAQNKAVKAGLIAGGATIAAPLVVAGGKTLTAATRLLPKPLQYVAYPTYVATAIDVLAKPTVRAVAQTNVGKRAAESVMRQSALASRSAKDVIDALNRNRKYIFSGNYKDADFGKYECYI